MINCEEIPESYTGNIKELKPDTVMFVDAVSEMKNIPEDEKLTYFVEDKVHFNKKGNEFVSKFLFEKMKTLFEIGIK